MIDAAERWASVRRFVDSQAEGTGVEYPRASLPHPREADAEVSVGWPVGQLADYRFPPGSNCEGLHVHEFADRWVVHGDRIQRTSELGEHRRWDGPAAACVGGALMGAAIGAAISKKRDGALAGAGFGLLVAALFLALDNLPPAEETAARQDSNPPV